MKTANTAEIYGLVLAGGKSRRMGVDKSGLCYGNSKTPQWRATAQLLRKVCSDVFLSVRKGQELTGYKDPGDTLTYPMLPDGFPDAGPLGGLLTAFEQHPAKAWLVVACDLPLLDLQTLEHLIANRGKSGIATSYISASDGLPEPLCALYEPSASAILQKHWNANCCCPRKILIKESGYIKLIKLPNPQALDNANTPEDFARLSG